MMNVVTLRREPDLRPCDTEPSDIAQGGMVVPTLSSDDRGWLARLFGKRREPTTYHRCLAVHLHFADPRNSSALR